MPQIKHEHLAELTRVSLSNKRELVKLRRRIRTVYAPTILCLWIGTLLTIKYLTQ